MVWAKATLLFYLVFVTLPLTGVLIGGDPFPDSKGPEQELAVFGMLDVVGATSGECATANGIPTDTEAGCAAAAEWHLTRAAVITRVSVSVGTQAWVVADQCDVELQIVGTPVAGQVTEFEVGGVIVQGASFDLAVEGATASLFGLGISVTAGQDLSVVHTTPTDTRNCQGGGPCVCTGSPGSYYYRVYGVWAD